MMDLEERRRCLVRQNTIRLSLLVWGIIAFIYAACLWSTGGSLVNQVRILTVEEAEEAASEKEKPAEESFVPEGDHGPYYSRIFFYSMDRENRLADFHNGMDWSREDAEKQMADDSFAEDWPRFRFLPYEGRTFRAYVMMWHTLYEDGAPSGKLYAGLDITGTARELLRLLGTLVVIGLLSGWFVRRSAESLAREAVAPLAEALKKQQQFTDSASHELRTPLAVVLSGINILEAEETESFSPMGRRVLPEMKQAVKDMKGLISDMLSLSRIDAGRKERHPVRIDSGALLEDILRRFSLRAEEKGLRLKREGAALSFMADEGDILQIMMILTDNAVKYTPRGGTVTLASSEKEGQAVLSVIDTGRGISEKDMPHIFERFYRSDEVKTEEGSGLGLAIADTLARGNGGIITVSSEEGKGSTFSVAFPKIEPAP